MAKKNENIKNLITEKAKANANAAKPEDSQRFMLFLSWNEREALRELCEVLKVRQISFATEIFVVALNDALAQVGLPDSTQERQIKKIVKD